MDGLSLASQAAMPPRAPLALSPQDFRARSPSRARATQPRWSDHAVRLAVFGPALFLTLSLIVGLARWLAEGGMSALEVALIALIGITFIWVSITVSTVMVALAHLFWARSRRPKPARAAAQRVALLMPIHNECPETVFGNAAAMLKSLSNVPTPDSFALFVLSDTQDACCAAREEQAFALLRHAAPTGLPVYYRRRTRNTDKKVGNIADWMAGWGADHDAMLVLDADSLMTGDAIAALSDALARDHDAGLIQTFPVLIGSETLFARMQQFSSEVHGWLLARGLALWSQSEGNYWGHNAIIRTRAFAEAAHLPHLKGPRGGLILSHDFVEAGMLRRAGWSVRFVPEIAGSFEESPATLVDYVLRDRRWCRGNLQHLRLLGARGLHPASRFHLLQGAMAFLLSPAWFALLVVWSVLALMPPEQVEYFNAANPLYPVWPYMSQIDGVLFLGFIYTMLLLPKLVGATLMAVRPDTARLYRGRWRFLLTTLSEILLSVLYAPILMVQQTVAVGRAILGAPERWAPQRRGASLDRWGTLLRFHWLETALGLAMVAGLLTGLLSPWLSPIALSLAGAVPLSWVSGVTVAQRRLGVLRLDSPLGLRPPEIQLRAREEQNRLAFALDAEPVLPIAAE
ncbi:MAG: glucans biosynthesis glucosyltransferase MdoH [Alphaproteobacteria bacterium]|nr:glucans biosynthesis glucosyltransferase MdoH [Alphaproteobacteria bacterium]